MNNNIRPWTAEEDAAALAMRRDGKTPPEIADALRRTRGAVSSRMRYLSLSAEARLQISRAKRNKPKMANPVVRERITQASMRFIPPEVLADRDRRVLAPRDITATLMGDPTFCRSALAQKSGVSA
jgi:hypothetical protein